MARRLGTREIHCLRCRRRLPRRGVRRLARWERESKDSSRDVLSSLNVQELAITLADGSVCQYDLVGVIVSLGNLLLAHLTCQHHTGELGIGHYWYRIRSENVLSEFRHVNRV